MASDGNDRFTLFVDRQIGKLVDKLSPTQCKALVVAILALALIAFFTLIFVGPFAMYFQEHGFGAIESWLWAWLGVIGLTTASTTFSFRKEIWKMIDEKCFSDIDEGRLFGRELKILSDAYNVSPETLLEVQRKSNTEKL